MTIISSRRSREIIKKEMRKTIFFSALLTATVALSQSTGKVSIALPENTQPQETLDIGGTIRTRSLPNNKNGKIYAGAQEQTTNYDPSRTVVTDNSGNLGYLDGFVAPEEEYYTPDSGFSTGRNLWDNPQYIDEWIAISGNDCVQLGWRPWLNSTKVGVVGALGARLNDDISKCGNNPKDEGYITYYFHSADAGLFGSTSADVKRTTIKRGQWTDLTNVIDFPDSTLFDGIIMLWNDTNGNRYDRIYRVKAMTNNGYTSRIRPITAFTYIQRIH